MIKEIDKEKIIDFVKEICSLDVDNQIKIKNLKKFVLLMFSEYADSSDLEILNATGPNNGLHLDAYSIAVIGKIGAKNITLGE